MPRSCRGAPGARIPAVLACMWLAGCNIVLGIELPANAVLDAGLPADDGDSTLVDGGMQPGQPSSDGGASFESLEPAAHPWAEWAMPNPSATGFPNPSEYSTETPAVVTDDVTHLEWQQSTGQAMFTWEAAAAHCASLDLAGGGFRLPSRIELLSLLDFGANEGIDVRAFPNEPRARFWSASPFVGTPDSAWLVSFDFGTGYLFASAITEQHAVRCVRGGASMPARHELKAEAELVTDLATGLVWEQKAASELYTWSDAETRCAGLELDGGGFRLPTLKELHTLIDERRANPAIDRKLFPGSKAAIYWTSSPLAKFQTYAWSVNFAYGLDYWFGKDTRELVRCVR
jgi:hypothetical protein